MKLIQSSISMKLTQNLNFRKRGIHQKLVGNLAFSQSCCATVDHFVDLS